MQRQLGVATHGKPLARRNDGVKFTDLARNMHADYRHHAIDEHSTRAVQREMFNEFFWVCEACVRRRPEGVRSEARF